MAIAALAANALLYRRRRVRADKRTRHMVFISVGFAAAALPYSAWRFFNPARQIMVFPFGHTPTASVSLGLPLSLAAEGAAAFLLSVAIWAYATLKPAWAEADVFD